ncbi:MAG: 30S ribosomal protein S17 [Planctomycetes bacterium]|nr:30S ribosomal protein S17 [Planctomycetota bacterium]
MSDKGGKPHDNAAKPAAPAKAPAPVKAAAGVPVAEAGDDERNQRRTIQGIVKSAKMQKTITVLWQRSVKHPRYGKFVQRHTKLHAHDEKNEAKVGDLVEIMATRPLSKTKTWRLLRVLRRATEPAIAVG